MMNQHTDYNDIDENDLVTLAQQGDKYAFGELYQRYVSRIYTYFYYRTGNKQDAEDLTTRVFMRALSHINSYSDRGVPFSAWLYRIAHNLLANWHRDNSRRKIIAIDEYIGSELETDAPEAITEDMQEQEELMESIRQLPADRQQLLFLKFVERLSNAEIGEIMNRTEGAVKSLYHRTLATLHEDLMNRGLGPLKRFKKRG
ncbi:MAG: sigma-70 family RNA polymerase sigma factor [Anaerolineales bacterium]|nr:sigma-70 family RNA polymerase sigma factor [Anaerolineales bacterium]